MPHILVIMTMLNFASAYSQLNPSEREFVDGFLRSVEAEASKRFERMTTTLERVSQTINLNDLDARTRDKFEKPLVKAAITERVNQMAAERDLTPDRIIREHAAIALANMRDFVDIGEDGIPTLDMSTVNRVNWSAVQQVDFEDTFGPRGPTRKIKIKLYNKQLSLDALAKWNGLDKGDNAEAVAYRQLPPELVKVSQSATTEAIADQYARFING